MKTKANNPASLRHFLRDKLYFFILSVVILAALLLFLTALRTSPEAITVVVFFFAVFILTVPTVEYWRRRDFYQKLLQNISNLDRAYLVLETLNRPGFYDGIVLYEALYAINKSMAEVIQKYDLEASEFRDYIEMWIHEVKTPLATLSLMAKDRKISAQINRLDSYVEQVLYFARAENAEHDYLIKPVLLSKLVSAVATKNQDILLASGINLTARNLDLEVLTDNKWLEFILNQILLNSIKYHSKNITISAEKITKVEDPEKIAKAENPENAGSHRNTENAEHTDDKTVLTITDDGIGISAKDLPRVFEKSFTGENGHATSAARSLLKNTPGQKSTGMGLYIAKTLCHKLGHQIEIASPNRQGAVVEITFTHHDYYITTRPRNHASTTENRTSTTENHTPAPERHSLSPEKHDLSKK